MSPVAEGESPGAGICYERLYEYRFRQIPQPVRVQVWSEISPYLAKRLGMPERVLDAAAGRGEFINAVPASERWAVDVVDFHELHQDPGVKTVIGDVRTLELPKDHFDGILVSNLLEHLPTQDDVGSFLAKMRELLTVGGRIAVLGPNFRYCSREYFDCADHTLALTHVSVEEHLYAAGFEIETVDARFLPYSFRSRLPTGRVGVRAYLRFPPAWRLLGKQFLVIGRRGA